MTLDWKTKYQKSLRGVVVFAACFTSPIGRPRFNKAIFESLALIKWHAQEHMLPCLTPATERTGAMLVRAGALSLSVW